jgi:hypothetical protein
VPLVPRARRTGTTPGNEEARFTGYDVLAQVKTWDDETTHVVLARLDPPRELRFFDEHEQRTAAALLDRLLAQDDDPRVPVLEMIDDRLAEGRGDGYRYIDMPEDGDAWHRSLAGLDDDARARSGVRFHELDIPAQMDVIEYVQTAKGAWHGMPAGRVFNLWTRYACTEFYSHPWAWNEIGFGGPAYPRGYANLGLDKRETWERPERDARDPVPWGLRAESAKRAHLTRGRIAQ